MPTLLHIDSSPLIETSVSRTLSRQFVSEWKNRNPNGACVVRDLSSTEIPPVSAEWIAANFTPEPARTPEQSVVLNLSESFVAEMIAAEEYVFGVPMHNFGVPATLKLWIDQIVRAGRTFTYLDGRPKGLLDAKKATVITASGGNYDEGTAMASLNHVVPYLRTVLGFVGVTDVTFINAGGTAALSHGADRQEFIRPHVESIRSQMHAA